MKQVSRQKINGTIPAPTSKSMMQRFVALAALSDAPCTILHPSLCDDGKASLAVATALGAAVEYGQDKVSIFPKKSPVQRTLSCGESGTSLRIFSAIAAVFDQEHELTGTGTLLKRPMTMIEDVLVAAGAKCRTNKSFIPLVIQGPLINDHIEIDGSQTSQVLSGLLIGCPLRQADTSISVKNLKSKPYIAMTLEAMRLFNITFTNIDDFSVFTIPGRQVPRAQSVTVEGDWSGASFMLVAGALAGSITITNINNASNQADRKITEALKMFGATITTSGNSLTVTKGNTLPFTFDATDCPDLFPPLVALASAAKGVSVIKGTSRLVHKESNRTAALISEYKKIGLTITEENDTLRVNGGIPYGATVDSHEDHRIAMSLAIAALRSDSAVTINNSSVVSKSYPDFFEKLESIYE